MKNLVVALRFQVYLCIVLGALNPATVRADSIEKSSVIGRWMQINPETLHRGVNDLRPDGSIVMDKKRAGFWTLTENTLVLRYYDHPEWVNTYELPARDGVLTGKHLRGGVMTMTRLGTVPLATPKPALGLQSSRADLIRAWNCHLDGEWVPSGNNWTVEFLVDGTWRRNGKPAGQWKVQGNELLVSVTGFNESCDRYLLPEREGKIEGKNVNGKKLTLRR